MSKLKSKLKLKEKFEAAEDKVLSPQKKGAMYNSILDFISISSIII